MTVPTPAPAPWTRLRGILIFVAIVWGVAGTFVGFELLALRAFDTLRGSSVALSRAVQTSIVCESKQDRAALASVEGQAWMLGVYAGTEARVAQWLTPAGPTTNDLQGQQEFIARVRTLRERVRTEIEQLANQLKVPAPPAFTPRNIVNAVVEYGPFIEGEADVTARDIATSVGRRACELYKLGSYWGFGAVMRDAGVTHPFAVEITYYTRRLDIPGALWEPMVAPVTTTAGQPAPDTDALTNGITRYLVARADQ